MNQYGPTDSEHTVREETSLEAERGASLQDQSAKTVTEPLSTIVRDWRQTAGLHPEFQPQLGGLETAIERVQANVALMAREHEGMADELLRAYEQLGIVFEITRKLMALHNEDEVIDLFVESLRSTYIDEKFLVVRPTAGGVRLATNENYCVCGDADDAPPWLLNGVNTARRERRVCVIRAKPDIEDGHKLDKSGELIEGTGDQDASPVDEVLLAPVVAGDSFVCTVVVWPLSETRKWESGDMLLLDSLATFCGDLIRNFRLLQELQGMCKDTVRALVSAVDQKDPYTSGHSNRVGYYAMLLGRRYGLSERQLQSLEWSALLHDVGKIGIRDDVLKKPGKLTYEEFEHIKEHPVRGHEVVRTIPQMDEALDGVLYHHERYNGKGYPKGLKGEEIPLQARLIQIADVFDALTTTRSYRAAFQWRDALAEMEKESGTVSDPKLSSMFTSLLRELHQKNPEAFDAIGRTEFIPDLEGAANDRVGRSETDLIRTGVDRIQGA